MYGQSKSFGAAPRGYNILYRLHEKNRCPGCGQSQWIVGRQSAECAFCATAIAIADGHAGGSGLFRTRGKTDVFAPLAA
ncbi:MAG: hypothetical protein LC634_03855 [Sphingomonadales bacterium]|nr:hypothetical protein [Sphingomonadales bacterium]